jgi:hypothetical protein
VIYLATDSERALQERLDLGVAMLAVGRPPLRVALPARLARPYHRIFKISDHDLQPMQTAAYVAQRLPEFH